MGQVGLLAGLPVAAPGFGIGRGGLGFGGAVGAGQHDLRHCIAEAVGDGGFVGVAAVFDGVVQQAGDGLVLVAAVFDHQGGNGQQVAEVRDAGALAHLAGVGHAGVVHGVGEAFGQDGHARPSVGGDAPMMPGRGRSDGDQAGRLLRARSYFSRLPPNFSSEPLNFSSWPLNLSRWPLNFRSEPLNFSSWPLNFSSEPLNFSSWPLNFSSEPLNFSSWPLNFSSAPLNLSGWPLNFSRAPRFSVGPGTKKSGPAGPDLRHIPWSCRLPVSARPVQAALPLPPSASLAARRRRVVVPWPLNRLDSPARSALRPWLLPEIFSRP